MSISNMIVAIAIPHGGSLSVRLVCIFSMESFFKFNILSRYQFFFGLFPSITAASDLDSQSFRSLSGIWHFL